MRKALVTIISIACICTGIALIYVNFIKTDPIIPDSSKYINTIDSLESEINNIKSQKDSIREQIDTVDSLLNTQTEKYEETRNIIITNNLSDDYEFFTNYLKWYSKRLDSINKL